MSISAPGTCRLLSILCLSSLAGFPFSAEAQTEWASDLLGRELVIVEKMVPGDLSIPQPLSAAIHAQLGQDFVEYEAFVAAMLPLEEAADLIKTALLEGRSVIEDPQLPVVLQHHTFRPENPQERTTPWTGRSVQPEPVPNLFLLRFAFPLLSEWSDSLAGCGVEPILYYGNGVFLARAQNLAAVQGCSSVAPYLSWAGAFLTTDRLSPKLLDDAGLEMKPYILTFAPGTARESAVAALPAVVEAGDSMTWDDGSLSLGALAGKPELEALLRTSADLISIEEASGEPQPSDERQGQILAGNYAGYGTGAISGAVTSPGYLTWLTNRGLRSAANQQTVAVFDTGYDDGSGLAGLHHPDLETPERLVDEKNFLFGPSTAAAEDTRGHGTMVAGIIAGDGTRSGKKDAQGFYLGTGIAPDTKLVAVQIMDSISSTNCTLKHTFTSPPLRMGEAITFSRVTSTGADKALISNHSWSLTEKTYTNMAQLFDQRVIDGDPSSAMLQPMTMVVSAGNLGASGPNTVLSPATAKNVIAVGSVQSYRPSIEPSAPPNACDPISGLGPEFQNEANNIARLSAFSSQGKEFGARGQGKPLVQTVRVKPDLVAIGERVFSTVPDQAPSTYVCHRICQKNWPVGDSHSYSSGTSFAAPAVSGIVALARKWFIDKGTANPSPSLLKAALIATATDLGLDPSYADDHRPSHKFGWGRVNLERLTDSAARFYRTDNAANALRTGGDAHWTVTLGNPAKDTIIVLVWSDPASPTGESPPLINDLRLSVERVGSSVLWRGNNFNENLGRQNNPSFPLEDEDGYSFTFNSSADAVNDTMNTVEAVFIKAGTIPAGQQLVIRVTGVNVVSGPQKFALYGYNVR